MTGRLDGQVALVSGGGRGIGRAIGAALAAAGSRVALAARSGAELAEAVAEAEAAGGVARAWTLDVTDLDAVTGVVEQVEAALGPITLLVNNAGTAQAYPVATARCRLSRLITLHRAPPPVGHRVEPRRTATLAALGARVGGLVLLGDHHIDAAAAHQRPVGPSDVGLVGDRDHPAGPGAAAPRPGVAPGCRPAPPRTAGCRRALLVGQGHRPGEEV